MKGCFLALHMYFLGVLLIRDRIFSLRLKLVLVMSPNSRIVNLVTAVLVEADLDQAQGEAVGWMEGWMSQWLALPVR